MLGKVRALSLKSTRVYPPAGAHHRLLSAVRTACNTVGKKYKTYGYFGLSLQPNLRAYLCSETTHHSALKGLYMDKYI